MRSQLLTPGDALALERSDPRSNASLSIAAAAVTERKKKPRGLRGRGGGGKGRGGKGRGKSAFAAGVAKKDGGRPFGRRFDQRWRHQLAGATCGDTFIHWPSRPPYVC